MKKFITILSVIAFAYANAEVVKDEAYYMKKHIIIGSDVFGNCGDGEGGLTYNITDDEFYLQEKVLYQELTRQNYKFPSQKEFESKIFHIFGLKLNPNSNIVSCLKSEKECHENKIIDDTILSKGTVILKNKRFITELYRFPEIVNYQKKYPYLIKKDKIKTSWKCETSDGEYLIYRTPWKDIYQHGKIVQKNLDNFVNLNNYLFNNDKSKIPQVFNNNVSFFITLVRHYGYTKDKDLLNWYNKEFKKNLKVGEKLKLERDGEWFHQEKKK